MEKLPPKRLFTDYFAVSDGAGLMRALTFLQDSLGVGLHLVPRLPGLLAGPARQLHAEHVWDHCLDVDAADDTGEEELLDVIGRAGLEEDAGQQEFAKPAGLTRLALFAVAPERGQHAVGDGVTHGPQVLARLVCKEVELVYSAVCMYCQAHSIMQFLWHFNIMINISYF